MKGKTLILLSIGSLLNTFPAQVSPESDGIKIFATLSEAAPRPARPLLLIFFSLDCHVCWGELFEMKHFIENNDLPVDLIGITCEPEEELRPFLGKFSFFSPVVADRTKVLYRRFRVWLEPDRVILDGERVLYRDDRSKDFLVRRDQAKRCLLEIACR